MCSVTHSILREHFPIPTYLTVLEIYMQRRSYVCQREESVTVSSETGIFLPLRLELRTCSSLSIHTTLELLPRSLGRVVNSNHHLGTHTV